jgi:hypothetical protein
MSPHKWQKRLEERRERDRASGQAANYLSPGVVMLAERFGKMLDGARDRAERGKLTGSGDDR